MHGLGLIVQHPGRSSIDRRVSVIDRSVMPRKTGRIAMLDNTRHQPTLVLSGTGKTGRRVVERLTARGLPVRVGSRSGETRFDWQDRSTWEPVLDGVRSAYETPLRTASSANEPAVSAAPGIASHRGLRRRRCRAGRCEPGRRDAPGHLRRGPRRPQRLPGADGVQRTLGREPRDFSAYDRDAAATGISNSRITRAA